MEGTEIHRSPIYAQTPTTYYGNGCPNTWDTSKPLNGGSATSCSTRIVQTVDSEEQKNGTYYAFQAATSGSGSNVTMPDNTNIADTFCPLGWQLPYSGTGGDYYDKSRSWKYLFITYGLGNVGTKNNSVRSYPLSYIASGEYQGSQGALFVQNNEGQYWSLTSGSSWDGYRLYSNSPSIAYGKADATPLRCALFILHRRHGGRKPCKYDCSAI